MSEETSTRASGARGWNGLSLALLIVSGVCGDAVEAAAQPQGGTIVGTVAAREGGRPIADAVVRVEGTGQSAVASRVGRFRIDGVPAGRVVLVTAAPGYLELRAPEILVPPNGTAQVAIELELTPNILERVQVTATKTPLSIGDVPAQTDIIDRVAIDRRGDQELVQAIANVPGLIVSGQLGPFDSVMLRGLPRDGNEFQSTLLLIDGVPQTDSRNSARVINLPINDTSQVEVVRGPNSALYGRTAIGGSVNVRTADPTPDQQFGAEFTGGAFGTLKGAAHASGPLQQWGGYYVSVANERNHGFYKRDTDFGVEKTALFAKVTFVPDRRSFASISVNRVLSDSSTATNVPIIDGRLLSDIDQRFDRLTNLNVPGTNYHQEEGRVTLNYTRELSAWANLVEVFGYRPIQYKFINDGDVIGSPFDLQANTVTMYPFEQQTDEDIFYQEVRAELTPKVMGRPASLIVGGSYEHTSGFSVGNLIFTDEDLLGWPLNYLNPQIPSRNEWQFERFGGRDYNLGSTGIFAQAVVEPSPRVILTAAGRYDRLALDNTLVFREGRPSFAQTFDAFSPKLSAAFRLLGEGGAGRPALNVYGTYSQAFLPPRRPSDLTGSASSLAPLKPEDVENYELGLKGSLADGRVSLEATVFRMTRDGIVSTVRQGPFFLPTNAGQHKYKGVETGVGWAVSPTFSLYANGAFYRNRFGTFVIESSGGNTVLTGNRLPIAPDLVVNGGVTFMPVRAIDLTVNLKHVGDVQVDQGNTFKLDPYTLVDAAVSWRRGPLRVTLSAHNLFDEEYYWNGDNSLGEAADVGRPRQVLLTTSVLFR